MVNYWEYPTNFSNNTIANSSSKFFLDYPAYITSGISTNGIMILVFLGFFILGLPFGTGIALTASAFVSFILSTYLWWNGALGINYPLIFFGLSVLASVIVGNRN